MKRIYLLIIALLAISVGTWAQTTRTWTGPASGGSWSNSGNWSGNTIPTTGNIVVFDNGFSGAVSGVPSITLTALRIEGNSTVTFNVTGDRTILISTNGSANMRLNIEAGSALILEGNGGNDISLELNKSGGTGSSNILATIAGTLVLGTNSDLDLNNGSIVTTVSGAIENVDGTIASTSGLSFTDGSFYRHQRNGGSIPTATWANNSTLEVTGVTSTIPTVTSFLQEFGNVIWNCPNQSTGVKSFAGNLSNVDGDLDIVSTGSGSLTLKISGTDINTTTVDGDFNLSGGFFYILESSNTHTLNVLGNVNLTGGTLARGGGTATLSFGSNGAQTYTRTGTTISGAVNFTVTSNAQVDFGTSTVTSTGTFTLSSSARIITSHPNGLSSSGNTGTVQTTNRSYSGSADYEFRGASTGNFSTTSGGGNDVRDLIINNTSGQVTMNKSFTVDRNLTLINGYITPGSNTLLVGTGGTSTSANGAYVNGAMQKQINAQGSAFTFYVGDAASVGLRAIAFTSATGSNATAGTGTSTFTARFIRANANTAVGNALGSGIARVSACEYWTLSRAGGSRNGTVNISWAANSDCSPNTSYVTNVLTLRVARYDGASWVNAGGNLGGGATTVSGNITSNSNTAFTAFALASSNQADNPLPVLFDGVKAYGKNEGVQLEWSNLTERDIIRYEVERSANGIDFYPINQQAPKSNRDDKASYTYFDASPINGANFYRIRVDEIGGKPVYSKILRVEKGSTKTGFSLYPNPVVGKQLTVTLSGLNQGQYSLQVYNNAGQRVYTTNINNVGAGVTQMIELPASLKTGVYVTVISGDSYRESKQFVLK